MKKKAAICILKYSHITLEDPGSIQNLTPLVFQMALAQPICMLIYVLYNYSKYYFVANFHWDIKTLNIIEKCHICSVSWSKVCLYIVNQITKLSFWNFYSEINIMWQYKWFFSRRYHHWYTEWRKTVIKFCILIGSLESQKCLMNMV